MLRENITGLCKKSGKIFGEILPHFIIGLDEACLVADATGHCRIHESDTKKRHEKIFLAKLVVVFLIYSSCCIVFLKYYVSCFVFLT